MKNKGTISHLTPEIMEAYLNGSLDNSTMHQVEKLMLESDFESEAMEGMSSLTTEERNADLQQLQRSLKERTRRKSRFNWWQLAAAIALLATVTYFLVQPTTDEPILADNTPAVTKEQPEQAAIPGMDERDTSDLIALNETKPAQEIAQSKLKQESPTRTLADEAATEENENLTIDMDSFEEETDVDANVLEEVLEAVPAEEMALSRAKLAPLPDSMENPGVVILEKAETENSKVGRIAGAPLPIEAQNGRTVHGRVILQDGTPIPGVNVAINGTNRGTVSDIDGYYQITVPNDASLVFSLMGMEQQEVTRPDREEINVTMEQDVATLSEVVVTGRGQEGITIGANPAEGQAAFDAYLAENLRYPDDGLVGTVIVRLDISPTGTIEYMKVIRSMGDLYDREALRLLEDGPKWSPALKNGNPVADRVRVKILFKKND